MNPRSAELAALLCNNVSVPWLTQRLQEMIAIPSENPMAEEARPGHREQEIGEYYLERMSEFGMRVSQRVVVPGRPNVFGIREGAGDGPTLMLCGHLDTVPTDGYQDAYAVREEGGPYLRARLVRYEGGFGGLPRGGTVAERGRGPA
jgi:acetylornithine deacetylase